MQIQWIHCPVCGNKTRNTSKRFLKLTDAMEKEQEKNQNRMQEIAAIISEEEHSEGDVQMFMGEIDI